MSVLHAHNHLRRHRSCAQLRYSVGERMQVRSSWINLPAVAGALLMQTVAPNLPEGHRWATYLSPDGAYQQSYPTDLLHPKAGGGQDLALAGPHHETAEISRPIGSVQNALRTESDWFNQAGGQITYASKAATWFVFSGIDKEGQFTETGGTVYERGVVIGPEIVSVRVAYPRSESAVFDHIAAAMGKCLTKPMKR